MKVHLPESVDEAVGLLDAGTLIAGGTHVMPRLGPTESLVSLRHGGPGRDHHGGRQPSRSARRRRSRRSAARSSSCAARSSRSPRPRSATWRRSAATCSSRSRTATSRSACSRSTRRCTSPTAATSACSRPRASSRRSASRSPSGGSTPRRCAAGRTPRRSSRSPPTAPGSRSAASPARRSARPPPRRRSPSGDIERAAELSVEAADPFDDAFASAWYRRRVLPVHVRRALSNASSVIELEINGEPREFLAPPGTTLLSALRDTLGLTAAKRGCGQGTCGTCTCLLDGDAVMSCLVPVETVNGSTVKTLEGVAAQTARSRRCSRPSWTASPPSAASARRA